MTVLLREARGLPVWGFPGQSNPYVRVTLGEQAVVSRRDCDTSHDGRYRAPVWNQEVQFLVEDAKKQVGREDSEGVDCGGEIVWTWLSKAELLVDTCQVKSF